MPLYAEKELENTQMNDQYVFISYAHKDTDIVLPCINAMKARNLNVWYDEGIQAGSEWPEYIADKVVHCTKFVLFISKAYLVSQNCKRELNFAISRKKDILSVFIEDVDLSPGMEMQLGTYQSVFRNRFPSDAAFHESLCNEQWLDACRLSGSTQTANFTQNTTTQTPPPQPAQNTAAPNTDAPNTDAPQPTTPVFDANTFSNIFSNASVNAKASGKKRILAAILAIILGSFGIHRFYLKKYKSAVALLIIGLTPARALSAIIGVVEGIYMLTLTDEKFQQKYCS